MQLGVGCVQECGVPVQGLGVGVVRQVLGCGALSSCEAGGAISGGVGGGVMGAGLLGAGGDTGAVGESGGQASPSAWTSMAGCSDAANGQGGSRGIGAPTHIVLGHAGHDRLGLHAGILVRDGGKVGVVTGYAASIMVGGGCMQGCLDVVSGVGASGMAVGLDVISGAELSGMVGAFLGMVGEGDCMWGGVLQVGGITVPVDVACGQASPTSVCSRAWGDDAAIRHVGSMHSGASTLSDSGHAGHDMPGARICITILDHVTGLARVGILAPGHHAAACSPGPGHLVANCPGSWHDVTTGRLVPSSGSGHTLSGAVGHALMVGGLLMGDVFGLVGSGAEPRGDLGALFGIRGSAGLDDVARGILLHGGRHALGNLLVHGVTAHGVQSGLGLEGGLRAARLDLGGILGYGVLGGVGVGADDADLGGILVLDVVLGLVGAGAPLAHVPSAVGCLGALSLHCWLLDGAHLPGGFPVLGGLGLELLCGSRAGSRSCGGVGAHGVAGCSGLVVVHVLVLDALGRQHDFGSASGAWLLVGLGGIVGEGPGLL